MLVRHGLSDRNTQLLVFVCLRLAMETQKKTIKNPSTSCGNLCVCMMLRTFLSGLCTHADVCCVHARECLVVLSYSAFVMRRVLHISDLMIVVTYFLMGRPECCMWCINVVVCFLV